MEKRVRISTEFDPVLLKRLDAYASKRYLDRSSALQQLVSFALREIYKKEAVQAYREGRMTIRQCADMLGVDYFEMNEILKSENINVIPDPEQGLATLLPELEDSFGKNP
ncbi:MULTISPECIES: UPF0175 family protein [Desulfofundulus]|jgi:predicted HTH domain antitoxin|uniref:Uncharacterized protein family (UPF0175) n=2 Tax=Desulfofundulus TaxID=2282741 RepID=A0A1M6JJN1_9FIRM|nr:MULTISPECIES: UPF0175 family protein [Desulfofundulus]AEG14131.1 hypothetical protein Desku_0513 [Desulfofundulus kuznetsovii DSM 6115]NHM26195.1 hypothetical protein [Desulfofundulus sp. TPOSR]SHJ46845.1 Uncharacterised protein family (UPF0175) [Desulfofundulus thermosubterraneus DSM 16057]